MTYPNGTSKHNSATPGQIVEFEGMDHFGENIGSEPFELLAVELKPCIPVSPYLYSRPA